MEITVIFNGLYRFNRAILEKNVIFIVTAALKEWIKRKGLPVAKVLLPFICFKPLFLENGRRYDEKAFHQVDVSLSVRKL